MKIAIRVPDAKIRIPANNKIIVDARILAITFTLFLGILPATSLLGFTFPWQYVLVPFFAYGLLFVFLGWVKVPKVAHLLITLWLAIIAGVFLSGVFSPLLTLGSFSFPAEIIQYIARMLFFVAFIVIFYNWEINYKRFYNGFIAIMLFGMGVGVIQFLDLGAISNLFRDLYSFSEYHFNYMTRETLSSRRISGVAHHATANGGIAAFTFIMVVSMYLFSTKKRALTVLGVSLVIFNIVAAQARMGYLTIAFSIVILYLVYVRVHNKGLKPTFLLGLLIAATASALYWLYDRGNAFITSAVVRWERLGEQVAEGGNRYGQVINALEQLQHPWHYLFGISRGVENTLGRFFMEVEPINILVLYGGVGFVLQYSLVLILLVYFYRNMKVVRKEPILLALVVASFVGLLSYQFFSGAYYFFREVYVGLFPWILMGACIGAVERFKIRKRKEDQTANESG